MRYLGIDYGTKRVGIAVSDEGGTLAFPKVILENNNKLTEKIKNICVEEEIGTIVIGVSYDEKGEENKIMKEILEFKNILEKENNLPVFEEKEFMTSFESSRPIGGLKNPANLKHKAKSLEKDDSKAAALILQRYLDKNN